MAIRYAVATGNWSAPGTWNGGASVPVDGDVVYANNFTVSLDVTVNQPNTTLTNASNVSPAITAGGQFRPSVDGITLTLLAITQGASGTAVFQINAGRTFTVVGATATGGGTGGTNAITLGTGGFDATFSGCTFVGGSGTSATNGLNVSASGTLQFINCTTRGGAGTSCHGISLASSGLTFSGTQELSLIQNSSTGTGSRAIDITSAFSSTVTFSGSVNHEKSSVTCNVGGGNVTYNVTSETIVTAGLAVGTAGLWSAFGSAALTINRPAGSLQLQSTNSGPYYLRKSGGTAVVVINGDLTCGTGTGTYAVSDDSGGSGSITLNGTLTGPLATANQSGISATAGGKVIVKCLARNPTSGQLPSMFGNVLLASDSQIVATTTTGTVTLVPSGSVGDPPSAANVRSGTVYHFGAMTGTCAVPAANQVAVGIPIDATVGTAVLRPQDIPQVLAVTTIATLASQTSFTLTSGSPDDNAYVGMSLIATSVGNSLRKEVGTISAYAGSTKTVTLSADPGVYTLAAGDSVAIVSGTSGGGGGGSDPWVTSLPGSYTGTQAGKIVADILTRLPAVLIGGRIDANVGSMSDNTLTAAALATSAGQELAAIVESYIINEGDATAVMQAIADKIAADWVAGDASPLAIVAAIKADATLATLIARIDATISSRLSAAGYVAPDNTAINAAAVSAASADSKLTTTLNRLGAWTGTGINTILGAFRAIMAKAVGLTPADISTGTTFDNTTDSAEAIRDRGDAAWATGAGGGGGSVSEEDIQAIVSGVKAAPNVNSGSQRLGVEIIIGDKWVQGYTLTPPSGYTNIVWSLKRNASDSDNAALLTVSMATGITRILGAAPALAQEAKGSIAYASGQITVTVDASITALLPAGPWTDGIKTFPANRHLRNRLPCTVVEGIVDSVV